MPRKAPKIMVQKKVQLDTQGHYRFYSPYYDPSRKKAKRPNVVVNLAETVEYDRHGKRYPNIKLQTEKQLVTFLKQNWGNGDYLILGFVKGRQGLFVFWRGTITDEGWQFNTKNYNRTEVNNIEQEINESESPQDIVELERELDEFKRLAKEERRKTKYGFTPYILASGKRGAFHMWEEPDYAFHRTPKETRRRARDVESMNLDDINNF